MVHCKNEKKIKLPNTPEAVVLKWQEFVDKDLLDSARLLSSGQALDYINRLDGLSDTAPLEVEENLMLNLHCALDSAGRAVCDYNFEDEAGFPLPGRLIVEKDIEQWKVSVVEDGEFPSSEIEEEVFFPDESELD